MAKESQLDFVLVFSGEQRVILFPDFSARGENGRIPNTQEALNLLNSFLANLNKQSARLIQVLEVTVDLGTLDPNFFSPSGREEQVVRLAIIEKI